MKRFALSLLLIIAAICVVSCKKDNPNGKYGVDGKTPLPKAVDLGIVVEGKTILWASFNLGASKEYDYGDYYAWGEVSPKADYSWNTYVYTPGDKFTKYCPKDKEESKWDLTRKPLGADGETRLLPEDDAAHVHLGGKWRMPSLIEVEALLALTKDSDYTWDYTATVPNAQGEDIVGVRVTRKSTGATIFLPSSGWRDGTEAKNDGVWGVFWSSVLQSKLAPDFAYGFSSASDGLKLFNGARSNGCVIRPVCEK